MPLRSYVSKSHPSDAIPTIILTNLFQQIKQLNTLDIEREIQTKENILILHNVAYDLKDVQKQLQFYKYNTCVSNLTAKKKTAHYEIEYDVFETVYYFNRSDSHSKTIYRDSEMIYVDCNNKVSLSPERISFQLQSQNFSRITKMLQHYKRMFKISKVLESFLKSVKTLCVPLYVHLTFPYTEDQLTFQDGLLQEKQKENR